MRKKNLGIVLAVAAGAAVAAAPLASAAPTDWATTYANLDGAGADERVTVRDVDADTHELVITFGSGAVEYYAYTVGDTGVRTPRVTDVNRDGQDEVVVSTLSNEVAARYRMITWVAGTGAVSVKEGDGRIAVLKEGRAEPGVGFKCDGSNLVRVSASRDNNATTYSGSQASHRLDGTTLRWVKSSQFFEVDADSPLLRPQQSTCNR